MSHTGRAVNAVLLEHSPLIHILSLWLPLDHQVKQFQQTLDTVWPAKLEIFTLWLYLLAEQKCYKEILNCF